MLDRHNPFSRRGRDSIIPTTSGEVTIGRLAGIMNFPQVMKGDFNSPQVAKPQVVGIEIAYQL